MRFTEDVMCKVLVFVIIFTLLSVTASADSFASPRRMTRIFGDGNTIFISTPLYYSDEYLPTGLYYNTEPPEMIYLVNSERSGFYADNLYFSDDGMHFLYLPMTFYGGDETAIEFYSRGELIKVYTVSDLVEDMSRLTQYTTSMYFWRIPTRLNVEKNITSIITVDELTYNFDITTSEIITDNKRNNGGIVVGVMVGIFMFYILIRKPKKNQYVPGLIAECDELMRNCDFTYAFCGGYALEMAVGRELRKHSDVDITVLDGGRNSIAAYLMNKGWNVYERLSGALTGQLRLITDPDDEKIAELHCAWALKPGCLSFRLEQNPDEDRVYDYEIIGEEQTALDFIEVIFNKKDDDLFVVDDFASHGNRITRELIHAIIYNEDGIPYLAPEIILFIEAHPAYSESDYHKEKNRIDFDAAAPVLPRESKDWFINALETAYPGGHGRIQELKEL